MITYSLFSIIIAISLILYFVDMKKFIYSIIIFYPLAAQMVSTSITVLGFSINLSMAYGGLIFLVSLIETIKIIFTPYEERHMDTILLVVIILFFFLCLLSFPFSFDKYRTFIVIIKIFTWLLLLLVSINLFRKKEDLVTISYMAMFGALIIIFSFFLSKFGIYGSFSNSYERAYDILVPSGEFFNQGMIIYPLVITIPMLMINLHLRIKRNLFLIVILIGLLVALSTFSRAAMVALVFGYLVFLFYIERYKVKNISPNLIFGILVFILALTGFVWLHPHNAFKRWIEPQQQIERGDIEDIGSGRVGFIINAFNYYGEERVINQLLGNGIGTSYIVNNFQKVVHNGFLEILIGCGLLGLICYLILLARIHSFLVKIIRVYEEKDHKLLACLGIMGFMLVFCAHFDVILWAVFPMSFFSIHIGATIGFGWEQIYPSNQEEIP